MRALLRSLFFLVLACQGAAGASAGGDSTPAHAGPTQGGPAPSAALSSDQLKALRTILSGYRAAHLDVKQARALLAAVHAAGIARGPALQNAMSDLGFSLKKVVVLANEGAAAKTTQSDAVVTPSGRVVPPRP